mmetsp:Transcript_7684/g.19552  ORF Transcript_7684/g.19552 Transcript_7684/m.19552 type:complete len:116 (+) Transcript_7684:193-540(+)
MPHAMLDDAVPKVPLVLPGCISVSRTAVPEAIGSRGVLLSTDGPTLEGRGEGMEHAPLGDMSIVLDLKTMTGLPGIDGHGVEVARARPGDISDGSSMGVVNALLTIAGVLVVLVV